MLDFLRKRKRNWIIIFFLGVIIVVFALFYGGNNKLRDQGSGEVAEINGEIISQNEYAQQYQRAVDRYRQMLKGSLTEDMIKGLNIKGNVIEELIQKKLVMQEARSLGLTASDDDIANQLSKVPEFQVAGRFNKDRYLQILEANRLLPGQFEEDQREQLTLNRLYSIILDAIQVNDAEVRERYRLENEKVDLNFIKLAVSDFVSAVKLSEDDVKKYYDRNKESMKEPLKLRIEYLAYPFDRFTSSVQVSDKEIDEYYQANQNNKFRKPKEVKARYISLRLAPDADAKQKDAARARAERIVKEARSGKDFAQLAKKESDDPSAAKGGDLGWLTQGQLPPQLASIFTLEKGQVSDVIDTPSGFQVVKVEDTKAEKAPNLKESSAEITKTLKLEKAKREAGKVVEADRQRALSGTDFSKLAQDGGATLNVTNWIANGEVAPEVGQNEEFYKSAFALAAKETSQIIAGNGSYYLLRVKERKEPAVPPLENVRAQIEKGLKESKAYEAALQKGNTMLDQLKKDKDIAKVASANDMKVEETGWFQRNAPQLPKIGDLVDLKAGTLPLSAQKPIADKLYTQKDAAYILAFKDSQAADMEQFEREKDNLKKQASAEARQRALIKFLESLKAKAKIKVNNAFLEAS
ncbi:MAG TPA: SurA N-terminal domain-containing protein [Candidatus Binatia bacterium]